MTEAAPWLKAMENGGIGEARAKAFLMDRFWVLERSVDIEGADYLVQRRITAHNFLDTAPPRLAIIQVKFVQNGDTSISIKKSYLCDHRGSPYNEFFLLVFTGKEDNEKSFLLSAADILQEFTETSDDGKAVLRASGSKVIGDSNYQVLQKSRALNRIEHALANADFMRNRHFLGSTTYIEISPDQIDEDLLTPLENSYGYIQKTFYEIKEDLQSTLFEMEQVVDATHRMLRTTDPEELLKIYEDEHYPHRGGYTNKDYLMFRSKLVGYDDFFYAVREYKARIAKLRELKIFGAYVHMLEQFDSSIIQRVIQILKDESVVSFQVRVTYDPITLSNAHVEISNLTGDYQTPNVILSNKGEQIIHYSVTKQFLSWVPVHLKDASMEAQIRDKMWQFRGPLQTAVDLLYLGPDFCD